MWRFFPEARALMQFPRARRDLLIWAPSKRRKPLFFVFAARSEPARSIRDSFPTYPLFDLADPLLLL